MTALSDVEKANSRKILVGIIDSHEQHRAQMVRALDSFYKVSAHANVANGLAELVETPPCVILIDVQDAVIDRLVELIRSEPRLRDVPLIHSARSRGKNSQHLPIDAFLKKPFRRSALIQTISKLVNTSVEAKWETLPSPQKAALRQSLDMFNGISDLIDGGGVLAYEAVGAVTRPVIESVKENQCRALLEGVRGHDNCTYVHSLRSATFLSLFGHNIGLSDDELNVMASGGLLYDIGKMSLPYGVLNKPDRLDAAEMELMKSHVTLSETYLRNHSDVPKGVLVIAGQHHEMLDGSGYPNGMRNGSLNELARMSAIVDTFGELTGQRLYKEAMSAEAALKVMTTEMAAKLDQKLIGQFREMLLDAARPHPL